MLRNYLKTAFRNLWRQKGYTLINLLGLAIGMTTCLLIFLYISFELSYDKHFKDYGNIYRVNVKGRFAEDFFDVAVTMGGVAPRMTKDFPEVKAAARIEQNGQAFFSYGEKKFFEENVFFVDSTFLAVFSFEMISGDRMTVLSEPYSIVLTESIARKYFPDEEPEGKMLRMNDQLTLKVTGVMRDPPVNTHMDFNVLISLSTQFAEEGKDRYDENWGNLFLYTYVLFNEGADIGAVNEKSGLLVKNAFGEEAEKYNIEMIPYLQPVSDIHLHSHLMAEIGINGDISYIYTFAAVAIFILIIASINFMNLATARSSRRAREVGLRKVCGAGRRELIFQFIGESLILSFSAAIVAIILTELAIPLFNDLTSLDITMEGFIDQIGIVLAALILLVGILAGSYPAFILSSFRPIQAMKGDFFRGSGKSFLRNGLVVFQFTISIILLISTVMIYEQLQFIRNKNLGFDKENILVIPLRSDRIRDKAQTMRSEMLQITGVVDAAISSSVPGKGLNGSGYVPEGKDRNSPWIIYNLGVDDRFIDAFGIVLREGRGFSHEYGTDTSAVIINETLVNKLGWQEPIGKKIYSFGDSITEYHVIGVMKDYHFKSLHDVIEPSLLHYSEEEPYFIVVKFERGNMMEKLETLRARWDEMESALPFDYFFLDEDLEEIYRSEMKMGQLFIYFTILAIFIACLGLFGLASYSAQQRTKEIGIRKVMGASIKSIMIRLAREYSRWVIISSLLAWPAAYLLMNRWLQSFAYRIDISDFLWVFVLAAVASLIIAIMTVTYQAFSAASADPVKALKYE